MDNQLRKICCLLMIALLFFYTNYVFASNENVELCNIPNAQLSASEIMDSINVGWNVGDSFDSKVYDENRGYDFHLNQEILWGNPKVSKELIDRVASYGFNTLRIPVTWYYNTGVDSDGKVIVGRQWLERVSQVVKFALDNNMYVIINSHHDQKMFHAGVSEQEMSNILNTVVDVWGQIASYFKDYDNRLMFEGFNEIDNYEKYWQFGDRAAFQMNQMNQMFVSAVRNAGGYNLTRNLLLPTLLHGNTDAYLNAFVLPQDCVDNHLIVAVHSYDEKAGQDIEPLFERLEHFSNRINAPVIITEMGSTTKYPIIELREQHASNYIARAAMHGIKCIWWDNGYEYAIIGRKSDSDTKQNMIKALMDGTAGKMNEISEYVLLNDSNQFELKMPNLSTGNIEKQYWGTIITLKSIETCGVYKYMLNLNVSGEASDIWLQRVVFYDSLGNYISGKEIQKKDYVIEVPTNAANMKISMNSPYRNIGWNTYKKYINNGQLYLLVESYN